MLKVKVSPPLRVSDRFAILTLQIFRSVLSGATAPLIYVLLSSEILQPKTGQNENKSSKNPGGEPGAALHSRSHSHKDWTFACVEGNQLYILVWQCCW